MASRYTVNKVLLCHPDRAAAVNAALEAQGFGPNNFQVPVIANADAGGTSAKFLAAFWKMTPEQNTVVTNIVGAAAKLDGGAESTITAQVSTDFKTSTIHPGEKTAAEQNLSDLGYKIKIPDLLLEQIPEVDPEPKIVK